MSILRALGKTHLYTTFRRYHSGADTYNVDTVVIGGGCVGLAIARHLSLMRSDGVLLVEKNETFGQETSSRNSEVIHAGLYYSPGSLKSQFCVEGNRKMYKYCEENNVQYSKCGKLIVATTEAEVSVLRDIYRVALRNGVDDIERLTGQDVHSRFGEHGILCTEALFSPSSGVVDSHGFMSRMVGDIESNGAMIAYNTRVVGGTLDKDSLHGKQMHLLEMEDVNTGSITKISCRNVVNSAGLWARKVSLGLLGNSYENKIPQISFVKGNYFTPLKRDDFDKISRKHLIYPIPSHGGLGVHATIDVEQKSLRFGPDTEWLGDIHDPDILGYDVNPDRAEQFMHAIGKYYSLRGDESLEPAYSGIRPKARVDSTNTYDFAIHSHDIPGFVALYGIESPGLTSCLAMAEYVCSTL